MSPIKNRLFDSNHGGINDLPSVDDIFGVLFFVKKIYRFYLSSLAVFSFFSFLFLILVLSVCISPTVRFLCHNLNYFMEKILK